MTRRAGTSSVETKALILETAAKEFADKGYQKASLRDICSNAGLTTGAMYFFFKNKEDLFENIIMPTSIEIEKLASDIIGIEFGTLEKADENERSVNECADEMAKRIFAIANENPQATKALVKNKDHEVTERQRKRLIAATKDAFSKKNKNVHNDSIDRQYSDEVADVLINIALDVIMHSITAVANGETDEKQIATVLCFMRGGLKAVANA